MATTREYSVIQSHLKEAIAASERGRLPASSPLIDEMGYGAAQFLEAVQEPAAAVDHALALPEYGDLVSQIMGQAMKGAVAPASLVQVERYGLGLTLPRCPFTHWSEHSQHVCHFIFSLAGHIAARHFGYAKVCFPTCPKPQDGACDVSICTDVTRAGQGGGFEYWPREKSATQRAAGGEAWPLGARGGVAVKEPALPTVTVSLGDSDLTIVVRSRAMHRALQAVKTIAPTSASVLVTGETGVGKELVARAVHALSHRSDRPFVAMNCGAIPETLIETTPYSGTSAAPSPGPTRRVRASSSVLRTEHCFSTKSTRSPRPGSYGFCGSCKRGITRGLAVARPCVRAPGSSLRPTGSWRRLSDKELFVRTFTTVSMCSPL